MTLGPFAKRLATSAPAESEPDGPLLCRGRGRPKKVAVQEIPKVEAERKSK